MTGKPKTAPLGGKAFTQFPACSDLPGTVQ
jgi:hypothetical protein